MGFQDEFRDKRYLRALSMREAGAKYKDIAAAFGVSEKWAQRLCAAGRYKRERRERILAEKSSRLPVRPEHKAWEAIGCDLGVRAGNVLANRPTLTIGDLASKDGFLRLSKARGVGRRTLIEIHDALTACGIVPEWQIPAGSNAASVRAAAESQ